MPFPRLIASALIIVAAATIAVSCSTGNDRRASAKPAAACTVNDHPISEDQLAAAVEQALAGYEAQGQPRPVADSAAYRQQELLALDGLVERQLLDAEADRLGIRVDDRQVDARLDEVREALGGEQELADEIERQGLSVERIREQIHQQLRSEAMFEQARAAIAMSDADLRRAFAQMDRQQRTAPASRKVAHIMVSDKALAERVWRQVRGGDRATFTRLAARHSLDTATASSGGAFEVVDGQTVEAFKRPAFALAAGAVSKPVRTEFGWHVIAARGPLRPARTMAFAEMRDSLRRQLRDQHAGEAMQALRMQLREQATVECAEGRSWQPDPDAAPPTDSAPTDTAPEPPTRMTPDQP